LIQLCVSVVLLTVSIYGLIQSVVFFPFYPNGIPGPGVFPAIISSMLLVSSIGLIVASFRKGINLEQIFNNPKLLKRTAVLAISMFLYYIILPLLGFKVTTLLYLSSIGRFLGAKGWISFVIVPIIITIALCFVFQGYLHVKLPTSILF